MIRAVGPFRAEKHIQHVSYFQDLISTPFHGATNAICWHRQLAGDFAQIVEKIKLQGNMITLNPKELLGLKLNKEGELARDIILNDFELLKAHGAAPILNLIKKYERDHSFPFFSTDVYSFHVDRSTIPSATFLCTYYGESSDILPNSQAIQKVLVPGIRDELKKLYDGPEEGFELFLKEYFFDLHYQAKPNATPRSLGLGHLWKLAIDHPESQVHPCIHRAPEEKNGQPRLMMIC